MLVQKEDTYSNFINSIKSDVTKKIYEYNLRLFMEFCSVDKYEDLIGQEDKIIPYLMSLREKKLSFNSISTRLNAIYHFYDMNDLFLNKKKIKMFKGEYVKKVDRAYTDKEIKKMLDVSDLRAKVVILLMASTGIRIGSIPTLRLKHLEKINNIYKLTVYEGSNSQYFTFCSPESAYYIDAYLQYRTKNGESLTKDSFLIREQFDITDSEQIRKSKGISIDGIESFLYIILLKSGVRSVNHNRDRKEVALAHDLISIHELAKSHLIRISTGDEIGKMAYGTGDIPFIRTSDISNWELKTDPKQGVSEEIYQSYKEKQNVEPGDVLVVRDGTYLVGTSCLLTKYDIRIIYCAGIFKITSANSSMVNPYLLFALLNTPIVKRQIRPKQFTRDVIDTLGNRFYEVLLPFPKDDKLKREITKSVKELVTEKQQFREEQKIIRNKIQFLK